MKIFAIIVVVLVILAKVFEKDITALLKNKKEPQKPGVYTKPVTSTEDSRDYTCAYKSRDLLSQNEMQALFKLEKAAEDFGYTVFTKVRLFDLVEPKSASDTGAKWKIQAKHVDFVICDKSMHPRWIVELSDSTHDRPDRAERDKFVESVLQNCGYKTLTTRNIDIEQVKAWLSC